MIRLPSTSGADPRWRPVMARLLCLSRPSVWGCPPPRGVCRRHDGSDRAYAARGKFVMPAGLVDEPTEVFPVVAVAAVPGRHAVTEDSDRRLRNLVETTQLVDMAALHAAMDREELVEVSAMEDVCDG